MIHGGAKAKRDEAAASVALDQGWIEQEVVQRVWRSLDLNRHAVRHDAMCSDDSVARAREDVRCEIDDAGSWFEAACEHRLEAREVARCRFVEREAAAEGLP